MKFKLITKHRKNCRAVELFREGFWDSPWAYITKRRFLTKSGNISKAKRNHTTYSWNIIICNDPNCNGEAAILENDILKLLNEEELLIESK